MNSGALNVSSGSSTGGYRPRHNIDGKNATQNGKGREGGRERKRKKNLKTLPKPCIVEVFPPNISSVDLLVSTKADTLNFVKTLQNISSC